ncbi:DUF4153 domain-containing protein [Hanstruepera marina]|uniref:DUF4153 domain-containing protein n=1 Tax=Hanstruepera marina TaxID=2873265 RepID=UPI001CA77757|nr:DUF4173 domain-containing protein [Hanstruepera marina]
MKNIILLFGAILFSTLFYKQDIGLNMSLFSIVTIIILSIFNTKTFKSKSTIALTTTYLITAIAIFFYNSSLSIIANCFAFFTLVGHVSQRNSSIYINWLNGLFTFVAGFFLRALLKSESNKESKNKTQIDYIHLIKIIGIPLAVIIVFILLYKNGNPVFNDMISKIDFSFINLQWLLLTVLGYFLFYNISKPIQVNPATELDLNTSNTLEKNNKFSINTLKKENQLGLILITLLNILIIVFLITDITYLTTSNDIIAANLSNQVHNGINALIVSIVIAIIIILYFFRGNLNFYKQNNKLKIATYCWIILNTILVVNIVIKDSQYIYYYGFTYKRIGVLVYLLLALIGLFTTALKVFKIKNLWFLFRVNSLTAYALLIISCSVNWDNLITNYNLYHAKSNDFEYLISLSNNNTFLLKAYSQKNQLSTKNQFLVDKKHNDFVEKLNSNTWQEMQFDNFNIEQYK